MSPRQVDVVVVGAGPAGLSAARRLRDLGVGTVEVLERESTPGGIPRHSFHLGYGVRDLRRVMSGPAYATRLADRAVEAGAVVRTGAMVTGWVDGDLPIVNVTSSAGREGIQARAVLLTTGARERPRPARLIPGSRPAGVWTTGQLQQAVYLHQQRPGHRAVVVGSELVAHSAVMTLHHGGCHVVAMVTEAPRVETYSPVNSLVRARYRFPTHTATTIGAILGSPQVSGIEIRDAAGRSSVIECDVVVFTGDWIPDHELARMGGLPMVAASAAPLVDCAGATGRPGVFAAGNVVHPVETADRCAISGHHVADAIVEHLRRPTATATVPIVVEAPLSFVAPGLVSQGGRPAGGRFMVRSSSVVARAELVVSQGGKLLARSRVHAGLNPGRPVHLDDSWTSKVDPNAGDVVVAVAGTSAV